MGGVLLVAAAGVFARLAVGDGHQEPVVTQERGRVGPWQRQPPFLPGAPKALPGRADIDEMALVEGHNLCQIRGRVQQLRAEGKIHRPVPGRLQHRIELLYPARHEAESRARMEAQGRDRRPGIQVRTLRHKLPHVQNHMPNLTFATRPSPTAPRSSPAIGTFIT